MTSEKHRSPRRYITRDAYYIIFYCYDKLVTVPYLYAGSVPPEQLVAARDGQRAVPSARLGPDRSDRVVGRARQTRVLPDLVAQTLGSGAVYVVVGDFAFFRVRPDDDHRLRSIRSIRSPFSGRRRRSVIVRVFGEYRRVAARRVTAEEMECHVGSQSQRRRGGGGRKSGRLWRRRRAVVGREIPRRPVVYARLGCGCRRRDEYRRSARQSRFDFPQKVPQQSSARQNLKSVIYKLIYNLSTYTAGGKGLTTWQTHWRRYVRRRILFWRVIVFFKVGTRAIAGFPSYFVRFESVDYSTCVLVKNFYTFF